VRILAAQDVRRVISSHHWLDGSLRMSKSQQFRLPLGDCQDHSSETAANTVTIGGRLPPPAGPPKSTTIKTDLRPPIRIVPHISASFPTQAQPEMVTFVSVRQLATRLSVSVPTIWRWAATMPDFPKPISLSPGTTRWDLNEVLAFELSRRDRSRC
jgi:prophage regulatory protein